MLKDRVQAISESVRTGGDYDPMVMWILAAVLLFVALLLGWWYVREKFIVKRRFQYRKPLPDRHDRTRRP